MTQAPADCGSRSSVNRSDCFQTSAKPPVSRTDAGLELVVDHERAGVDVADRVDQADDPTGTTHVEPGQWLFAERVEVEERVAGEHVVAVGEQPVVEIDLLLGRSGAARATKSTPRPDGRSRVRRSSAPYWSARP